MRKITITCTDADAKTIRMALDGAYQSYQEETCDGSIPTKKKKYAYVGGMKSKPVPSQDLIETMMAGKNRLFTRMDLVEMARDQYRFAPATTRIMIWKAIKAKTIKEAKPGWFQWIGKK